jgi:two-component system response regulator FlrC
MGDMEERRMPASGVHVGDGEAAPAAVEHLAAQSFASASGANMKDLERQHILETLARVGGSRKKAVEALGISERTLRYKLKQYREEGFFDE